MRYRTWFRAGATLILAVALSSTVAMAQGHGNGHGNGHGQGNYDGDDDRGHGHGHDFDHGHGHAYGHYKDHDAEIRGWYRAHYASLPPGLAKRDRLPPGLERQLIVNGTLPPGLQKKMQPCPPELETMLPPPPPNFAHVVIGGNLVLVNRANFQVADVFHLDINIH